MFISLLRGCRFVRFVLEVLRSPLQFAASVSGRRTRGEKHVARARWLVPMRRGEPCWSIHPITRHTSCPHALRTVLIRGLYHLVDFSHDRYLMHSPGSSRWSWVAWYEEGSHKRDRSLLPGTQQRDQVDCLPIGPWWQLTSKGTEGWPTWWSDRWCLKWNA